MKKTILIMLMVAAAALYGQTAGDIIARADEKFVGDRIWSVSTMTVVKGGKTMPVQEMEGYTMDRDGDFHSLTVYRSPARMKGTAYLMIEDDLWVRFSSTGRIRKLSSSAKKNSAGGSDFSYADMGEGNNGIGEKYDLTLTGTEKAEGLECYVVEMVPKAGEDSPYERISAYVDMENYRYVRLNYYDGGAHIKSMFLEDYRPVGDKEYPFTVRMQSHAKDSVTLVETKEIEFDSTRVEERFFSNAYLQTIR